MPGENLRPIRLMRLEHFCSTGREIKSDEKQKRGNAIIDSGDRLQWQKMTGCARPPHGFGRVRDPIGPDNGVSLTHGARRQPSFFFFVVIATRGTVIFGGRMGT